MSELTKKDYDNLSAALSYAMADRSTFLDSIQGCGMADVEKKTRASLKSFDATHEKIFGTPTSFTLEGERLNSLPKLSIHDPKGTKP